MLKLNFKKTRILSAVLALSTFGTIVNVPNVSAEGCDNFKSKSSSFIEKIKSGTKKFKKEHPKLLKAGIGIGGTILGVGALGIGVLAFGDKIVQEVYLRDVTTAVDNMSDKEVEEKLKNQIETFKDHDRSVFVIEDELIKKAHPRLLLIILMKINRLFEKYPVFTRELIESRKFMKSTFSLKLVKRKARTVMSSNMEGVGINELWALHFKKSLAFGRMAIDINFHPPAELNQIIEFVITHEMGHVLQFLIAYIHLKKYIVELRVIRIYAKKWLKK